MQTSRFQLGLIATLAVGLGLSLASSDAVGYPAGAAVSMGSNPVVSTGGQLVGSASAAPLTVPDDSSLVITSVVLSAFDTHPGCMGNSSVVISDGTDELARFIVGLGRPGHSSYSNYEPVVVVNMPSGIHIPASATLTVTSTQNQQSSCNDGTMNIEYTVSGYYAQA
jgi:hypothetical protein